MEVPLCVIDLGALFRRSGAVNKVFFHLLHAGTAVLYLTPSGTVGEQGDGGVDVVYYGLFDAGVELTYLARLVVAFRCVATRKVGECVGGAADVVDRNIQMVNYRQECLDTSAGREFSSY